MLRWNLNKLIKNFTRADESPISLQKHQQLVMNDSQVAYDIDELLEI